MLTPEQAARFWVKVDKSNADGCWPWTAGAGAKTPAGPEGYGVFWLEGRNRYAHRVSYLEAGGELLPNQMVDHINCQTKLCVRPDHLRPATPKQNMENRRGANRNNVSSGVRGVSRGRRGKGWIVQVGHNGKNHYGGSFERLEDAAEAARLKRQELHDYSS